MAQQLGTLSVCPLGQLKSHSTNQQQQQQQKHPDMDGAKAICSMRIEKELAEKETPQYPLYMYSVDRVRRSL